jgi:hypothetical protein
MFVKGHLPQTVSNELLKLMYDGQLKKMLAYVAVAITTFGAQLVLFYSVIGGIPSNHIAPAILVATVLWLSQCYFAVAVVAKYHELKILENRLGITKIRGRIYYPNRPRFGRLWDRVHRQFLGVEAGDYARLAMILDWGTFVVPILVSLMYAYLLWAMVYGL